MKFRVSMKTPDALDYALEDTDEDLRDAAKELCERWFSYGECVTIEIDTDAETATVLEARK